MPFGLFTRRSRPPDKSRPASSTPQNGSGATCAKCHGSSSQRGSQGECLRCLVSFALLAEEEPWTDFPFEEPLLPKRCYGHFELVIGLDGLPVELGSGATATTYRARDTVLETTVALKVIDRTVAGNPTARARFLREARVTAGLSHPNVAAVFFYGEQKGECFYAMELIEGETLQARLRREGPFSVESTLDLGLQIAGALEAAEACGVVHRDLKPSNLMIVAQQGDAPDQEAPLVKVIDWGLAKAVSAGRSLGADHTRDGFVGTPAYASPEQFAPLADRRIDTCSDIYSLGITLWYLLCGRTPFAGDNLDEIHAQQTGQPLPVGQLKTAGVPAPVIELLQAMLTVHPGERLQSARELIGALTRCRQQLAVGRRRIRRLTGSTLAAGMLCGLFAHAWTPFPPVPPPVHPLLPPRTAALAVLPFEDLDADAADPLLVKGVGQRITDKLGASRRLEAGQPRERRGATLPPGRRRPPRRGTRGRLPPQGQPEPRGRNHHAPGASVQHWRGGFRRAGLAGSLPAAAGGNPGGRKRDGPCDPRPIERRALTGGSSLGGPRAHDGPRRLRLVSARGDRTRAAQRTGRDPPGRAGADCLAGGGGGPRPELRAGVLRPRHQP